MRSHRRTKVVRPRHSGQFRIDQLEDRRLLTALVGGDSFEYLQQDGVQVRINLSGDIIAEVIGAVVDDQNNVILTDFPGEYVADGVGRASSIVLGGIEGRDGCDPIGFTNIADPRYGAGSAFPVQEYINYQNLASNGIGETYGINLGEFPINDNDARKLAQLAQFDTATGSTTVTAMLQGATLREDTMFDTKLAQIGDVAFDPTNSGMMYAIVEEGGVSTLYRINILATDPTAAVTKVGPIRNGARNMANVSAMTFDDKGQLYIIVDDYDGDGKTDTSKIQTKEGDAADAANFSPLDVAFVAINKANPTFTPAAAHVITVNNYETTAHFTAMTYDEDAKQFYAVANEPGEDAATGGAPQLYMFQPVTTGNVVANVLGEVPIEGDTGTGGTGQDQQASIDGLAWSVDIDDNVILVGLNRTGGQLININVNVLEESSALNYTGSTVSAFGLASYTLPTDTRPLLYTIAGGNGTIIRGSSVCLDVEDEGASAVDGILGSSFNPLDGLLYFTTDSNDGRLINRIDVHAPNRSAIQNSMMRQDPARRSNREYTTLVFDQTSPTTAIMYLWGTADNTPTVLVSAQITATVDPISGEKSVDIRNMNVGGAIAVTLGADEVTDVHGLALFNPELNTNEDPNAPETFIYALEGSGADSRLLRIRIAGGTAMIWGLVRDYEDILGNVSPVTGENIKGLTWNPAMINPFTFQPGALLGTDVNTDELVIIDPRLRPPEVSVFTIKIVESGPDSTISIAQRDMAPGNPVLMPFSGSVGTLRVVDASNSAPWVTVEPRGETGAVLLGAKTRDISDKIENEELWPIADARLTLADQPFGMLNPGDGNVKAGLYTSTNILQSTGGNYQSFMIGNGFGRVEAASARDDGSIAVVDSSALNAQGTGNGARLGFIPRGATRITMAAHITEVVPDATSPTGYRTDSVASVAAMDWGDPLNLGAQQLYAVVMVNVVDTLNGYVIRKVPTFGIINADPASPEFGRFTRLGQAGGAAGGITAVQGMAFSPEHRLYILDQASTLRELDPVTGMLSTATAPVVVGDANGPLVIESMEFGSDGTLIAHALRDARLVSIDLLSGVVGGMVNTPAGSMRASVGAITLNPINGEWLAFDNSLSWRSADAGAGSSMLLGIRGFSASDAAPQDIGRFSLGGTFLGDVDVSGSMDMFYSGWLLSGTPRGLSGLGFNPRVDGKGNFHVGGDLRNLITPDSIGTQDATALRQLNYRTGFDMTVGGRVGQIQTLESMTGAVDVTNSPSSPSLSSNQWEIETHTTQNDAFLNAFVSNTLYNNDSFDTAQYLGTINTGGEQNVVQVDGSLVATQQVGDYWDYYGVALMAGQTVTVQLIDMGMTPGMTHIGVFDPDGRLVATDYSDWRVDEVQYQPFQVTADRPGIYRFAVATYMDGDFNNGIRGENLATQNVGSTPYQIRISGAGNLGLGGLTVATDYYDARLSGTGVRVQNGDLGGIRAGGTIASDSQPLTQDPRLGGIPIELALDGASIEVSDGNLRAIDGGSVGRQIATRATDYGVTLDVPHGSVGHLRARGSGVDPNGGGGGTGTATDALVINPWYLFSDNAIDPITPLAAAIGGSYQLAEAPNTLLEGNLWANGSIGVVRANVMDSLTPGSLIADADRNGRDGVIDLIDVAGDLGTLANGGPVIETGPGGNVRYMRVGGNAYRDLYYGGGAPDITLLEPGESVMMNDDSGSGISFQPGASQMSILTYGIRGSGGSAVVRVTSTAPAASGADVMTIRGSTLSSAATAEIGQVVMSGAGAPVQIAANGRPVNGAGPALQVTLTGTAKVDVFDIRGNAFTSILNSTGGDIVNVTAASIGRIEAGNLGYTPNTTGAAVNAVTLLTDAGGAVVADVFPFYQQRTGIVSGSIVYAKAKKAAGNIYVNGSIGQLVTDGDSRRGAGQFEGINGAVYATGDIWDVNVGAGIVPAGTGNLSQGGLYANGVIGQVRGKNAVIRGNVVASGRIDRIALTDASSIINANIMTVSSLAMSREMYTDVVTPHIAGGTLNRPVYDIGAITITGTTQRKGKPAPKNGGIIGTVVMGGHIGTTVVRNGFGLINSYYGTVGNGTIKGFDIDGYGIRDSWFDGGAKIGTIKVTGKGNNLASTNYDGNLRLSEHLASNPNYFDPFFHVQPNRLTDLHAYLKTSANRPTIAGITNAGLIAGTDVRVSRSVDLVQAYRVTGSNRMSLPGVTTLTLSNFNVANAIKNFYTTEDVEQTTITTGGLSKFWIGRSVRSTNVTVSGIFSSIRITGDYESDAVIQGIGPNGELSNIFVNGRMMGTMAATRKIGKVTVRGGIVGGRFMQNGVQVKP